MYQPGYELLATTGLSGDERVAAAASDTVRKVDDTAHGRAAEEDCFLLSESGGRQIDDLRVYVYRYRRGGGRAARRRRLPEFGNDNR